MKFIGQGIVYHPVIFSTVVIIYEYELIFVKAPSASTSSIFTIMITVLFQFWNFTCSQLCDEIDKHEKNSQDMIEEEKKKIPGT